jgi:hypothetical protein
VVEKRLRDSMISFSGAFPMMARSSSGPAVEGSSDCCWMGLGSAESGDVKGRGAVGCSVRGVDRKGRGGWRGDHTARVPDTYDAADGCAIGGGVV